VPHDAQRSASGVPHWEQKRDVSLVSA